MKRITNKILFTLATILLLSGLYTANAQYSISSPYSRFGIGYIRAGQNATLSSLGGIGYAFSGSNEVNTLNPASYSAVNMQSFVFNIGFDLTKRKFSDNNLSSNAFTASISNISLAFPVINRLKMGIALSPLTEIDYLGADTIISSDINRVKTFSGNGGIDRFTVGLAYQPVKSLQHNLSVGANVTYYFGNLYRSSSLEFLTARDSNGVLRDTTGFFNNRTEKNYNVSSLGIDFGLQYFYRFKNSDELGIGLTFTPKHKLNTDKKQIVYTYYNYAAKQYIQDTLSYSENDSDITMPMRIGFGLSYHKHNKFFAEADFTYTKWSEFEFEMQQKNTLKDNWQMNLGIEYIPNAASIMYYEKMAYRIGFHYDNGYIFLQDNRINDIGISFGIALPIKKLGTKINLSLDCGKQGTNDNNLIKENYFRIGMSLSASDRWFVKRKYQ
ncbi:MAG: hypothetical protein IJ681_01155 [Bacteroidales bacterium]|nr:hypothetical protein [Bacteroidales bacterium]